ncbi:hypothetical protein GW17_00029322 [Ensete ventricosum]|nr:hypothetical protein GW17_00029322 [Ensete ventricosum]
MPSPNEVYLSQRDTLEWTTNQRALVEFNRFKSTLKCIEDEIIGRNDSESLKNRNGVVQVPCTLLFPTSERGLIGILK